MGVTFNFWSKIVNERRVKNEITLGNSCFWILAFVLLSLSFYYVPNKLFSRKGLPGGFFDFLPLFILSLLKLKFTSLNHLMRIRHYGENIRQGLTSIFHNWIQGSDLRSANQFCEIYQLNFPSVRNFVFRETTMFLYTSSLTIRTYQIFLQKELNHTLFSCIWIAFWPQTPQLGSLLRSPIPPSCWSYLLNFCR